MPMPCADLTGGLIGIRSTIMLIAPTSLGGDTPLISAVAARTEAPAQTRTVRSASPSSSPRA